MVFENAILFLRDALLTGEFADAVKRGDSGRIVIILRLWAFAYRGNGRTKYAHEMLHVLHNLICVWTNELRGIVLQNWLANPQGKFNSFVEIDLVQEHLNFWIKKIYKADGAGHSWDWLALFSPCVDILRQLATRMNVELGTRQGSKLATTDLANDIAALMASLNDHEVYVEKEGRVLDDDEKPVPDVISVGMAALTMQFDILRERRRLTPVAELLGLINTSGIPRPTPATNADLPTDASAEADDDDDEFADLPELEVAVHSDNEDEPGGDVELEIDDIPEWYLDEDDEEYSDSDSDGEYNM
ncbi:hypothetical protein B0H14DRAFT_2727177 [Mycena olivaceomarginata]|nr:hypothetical protein B0H14DRAFT_2727177 [Mycena olivaceomarginata]